MLGLASSAPTYGFDQVRIIEYRLRPTNSSMRITPLERQAIKQTVTAINPDARIYLFGSRADDASKGGDIDLLAISSKITLMDKLDILADLHRELGEQKIDLIVESDLSGPFARLAVRQGVAL